LVLAELVLGSLILLNIKFNNNYSVVSIMVLVWCSGCLISVVFGSVVVIRVSIGGSVHLVLIVRVPWVREPRLLHLALPIIWGLLLLLRKTLRCHLTILTWLRLTTTKSLVLIYELVLLLHVELAIECDYY